MRDAGFIAAVAVVLVGLGCGPDPNAQLPGMAVVKGGGGGSGGDGSGGITGSGGTTREPGSGGRTSTARGGSGGTGEGGSDGSGGVVSSGGRTSTRNGGATGAGGTNDEGGSGGGGGRTGTGGSTTIRRDGGGSDGPVDRPLGTDARDTRPPVDLGGGEEPCVPAKTITGTGSATTGNFGTTGPYCFRTPDNIVGWDCSNFTGRTLKVNNVETACAKLPLPAKLGGYYYFDASGGTGAVEYASIYWY